MKFLAPIIKSTLLATAACGALAASMGAGAAANEQFIPLAIYRTGPMATSGIPIWSGFIDYMDMTNKRDGGINGVKLVWEECETEYKTDRGIECYERLKKKGPTGATTFMPGSTAISYAVLERAAADKIPMINVGYGRTDASDGRVFPYVFPLLGNYLSGSTTKIKFMGLREGGMDKLKGKKIVNLYHGSAFGKETIPILDIQGRKYGFEITHIEVPHPGNDQQSQWLQIRQIKPDWVILRGFGIMNSVALKTAQKVGYPADRIVGTWQAAAEEDVLPAGDAAKGYIAAGLQMSGSNFPVIQEIAQVLYSGGKKGNLNDPKRIGTHFYNYGVVFGILHVEAIRTAQEKFGKKPLTGEQTQWGLEHLNIDDKRLKQIGALGFIPNIKTSCLDHEGGGSVKFKQWDGQKWITITDWIKGDPSLVRPLIEESAAKYAKEKNITPRDCSKE